ncbi:uncharacterized protein LOC135335704 [Halichondria panicea]|uniref:uncharacterized protein LOC135335704 n=1 Tax=Halichondria panicea TaxID=6063 RepID=UPI00312B9B64
MALLQNQQSILQQVLQGQINLENQQSQLQQRLDEVEKWRTESQTPLSSSSPDSSSGKRKRVVTRELTVKVSTVHANIDKQFVASQMFSSTENKLVHTAIIKEISQQPDCKFSEKEIKVAVKRCFENLRRQHLQQQDGKEEFAEEQSKRRKYRSRRERKFQRRANVVTPREMERYWRHLNLGFMTEESDDPENPNGIVEHRLLWRSQKLDEFMEHLDGRQEQKSMPAGLVAKKVRRYGEPSKTHPPADAPKWAVRTVRNPGDDSVESTPEAAGTLQ